MVLSPNALSGRKIPAPVAAVTGPSGVAWQPEYLISRGLGMAAGAQRERAAFQHAAVSIQVKEAPVPALFEHRVAEPGAGPGVRLLQ